MLNVCYKEQTSTMWQFYLDPQGLPGHHIPLTSKVDGLNISLLHVDLIWDEPNTIMST